MGKRDASHFITEYYTERGKVELMIPTDATDDDFALLKDILALVEAKMKQRADRKTENCSEKPNNCKDWQDWKDRMWAEAIVTEPTTEECSMVDKDINVRSKDEPQYEMGMGTLKCNNCSEYGSFKCTKCDGEMYFKRLEPKDEPQTETEIVLDPSFAELSDEQFVEAMKLIEPQTERHLPDYSYEADLGRRIMDQAKRGE